MCYGYNIAKYRASSYYFQKNIEIFVFFQKYFFLKEIKGSDRIFENIPFVEMGAPKLINYWTNMCPKWPRYASVDYNVVVEGYKLEHARLDLMGASKLSS